MPLSKQQQSNQDEAWENELKDTTLWNRAKVKECIVSAVMTAQRISHGSLEEKKLLAS